SQTDPNWRERYASQLGTAEEAVAVVEDGAAVYGGVWTSVPTMLCNALAARAGDLKGVTVGTALTPVNWDTPVVGDHFRVVSFHAGPYERKPAQQGRFDFVPVSQFRDGQLPPGFDLGYDVAMIPISPPDADGYCSFGGGVWFGPTIAAAAKALVGEV